MDHISVALVEPEYPVNVGYVARLLKNFGVPKLYFINAKIDLSVASIYASHGADVLDSAECVDFGELRRRHELLVATSAVRARRKGNVVRRSVRLEKAASYVRASRSASLVLGRDTTGLTNEEIKLCDIVTTVDTGAPYNTLNVSHAAAIMLYLIYRGRLRSRIPSKESRDIFGRQLYDLALATGFRKHKRIGLKQAIKRIAATSQLTEQELFLMTGIFRKAIGMGENDHPRTKT
ncbi:MAG: hypothetical protein OK422_03125 [Thaumarchaeota archaeon]|nr:hypothetical protein [Nitrososphaerota archaeon]